jgi:hypothetical protein
VLHQALSISILKGFKPALQNPTRWIVNSVQIFVGSLALNCFSFELLTLSKNKIEYMSLQIAVTTGRANSITPCHEVENFKTILVQSSKAVLRWGSKQRPTRGEHLIQCMANLLVTLRSSEW